MSLLYEAAATVSFNAAMTSCGVLAALLAPHVPGAAPGELILALVMGFLSIFPFLFPGTLINPAAAVQKFYAGALRPVRFLALGAPSSRSEALAEAR